MVQRLRVKDSGQPLATLLRTLNFTVRLFLFQLSCKPWDWDKGKKDVCWPFWDSNASPIWTHAPSHHGPWAQSPTGPSEELSKAVWGSCYSSTTFLQGQLVFFQRLGSKLYFLNKIKEKESQCEEKHLVKHFCRFYSNKAKIHKGKVAKAGVWVAPAPTFHYQGHRDSPKEGKFIQRPQR